jgi:hypothetical protein
MESNKVYRQNFPHWKQLIGQNWASQDHIEPSIEDLLNKSVVSVKQEEAPS